MATYKTPGVYVEEVSLFPPSVAQVETAIPAFIGYTEKSPTEEHAKIKSMVDYRDLFGGPSNELPAFTISTTGDISADTAIKESPTYRMYYMLQLYFANGGGPCYVFSVGAYKSIPGVVKSELVGIKGLLKLKKEDEPTLILFPDGGSITQTNHYHDMLVEALGQCAELGDRFAICDVRHDVSGTDVVGDSASGFRTRIGTNNLMYGAAYFPNLKTSLSYQYNEDEISITHDADGDVSVLRHTEESITSAVDPTVKAGESLYHASDDYRQAYYEIKRLIENVHLVLPPSAAIAGVYARVDGTRGVWKAPANVSLNRVVGPTVAMERSEQDGLNVHTTGKSINAIRSFTGKGTLVWGARTLDGNSNEWRYVPVRRFFNMVEESTKKATERFVFEPNDANTWVKVKSMIENFLTVQWRAGALMGAKPEHAFYVKVGLGETMTQQHVLNGEMIIQIGMAVVRPAEFIILRFSHKMIES